MGRDYLRDTLIGRTNSSWGTSPPWVVWDSLQANTDLSGQGLYAGAFMRVASGDYRVGSFNTGSGAFAGGALLLAAIASGADYEASNLLSAAEKDKAIDYTIQGIRINQEVAIPTVQGNTFYVIDGAASPAYIESVNDVYYFSDPAGSQTREPNRLGWFEVKATATGTELRIAPALQASQQIVLDAILVFTLGAGDAATINIPDGRLVLWGAEAECWDRLSKRSPGTATQQYQQFRDNAARQYSMLSARFKPQTAKRIQFDGPGQRSRSDGWGW